ncbi:TIGR03960 family B12-binding radical SAM protein [Anaeropeptidivorans aminofermentans]|uniref:TIGR03960 family B12-binding radical SAM protein n=1 Tax=Anaeropeptidivorans aminofermentans TaxID=2934315 RepID=UPI002024A184|nr:TIGR03960 family B12-binding radical SAM protein [Anaeropeptidivorans aminofermentans]
MTIPEEILLRVTKPARYIGGEINMVKKNPENVDIRFAFCFPDVYEIGMSHLGLEILYYFFNRREDTYCERVFAPWTDMEEIMREEKIPLFTLESFDPLNKFDFIGFTLQYEMSYTNLINMLDLAGIPILSKDRKGKDYPIICAGGPCAYNPEPLADIVDFFYIGEGEAGLDKVLDLYKKNKKNNGGREKFLESILDCGGIYVPEFYDVEYDETGEIKSFKPNHEKAPEKIMKLIVKDMDNVFYPERQLVPLIETVHSRAALEIFRGCIRGCRFCQAGFVYRPVREKSWDKLMEKANTLIENTGHEEISLISLSTSDYTGFAPLATGLINEFTDKKVNISLPSLRIDAFNLDIMNKVQEVRKSSLTFAPEAGTQRLRDIINKGLTEEEILEGAKLAFEGGWNRVKLYFMMGLPGETYNDIEGIAKLAESIADKYYEMPKENRSQPVSLVLSTACFVPKPFTPFQWEGQNTYQEFMEKQRFLKSKISRKQIRYNYHDAYLSVLEGVIARGDRRVSKLIIRAWELGARFDGWTDLFKPELWEQAFKDTGISIDFYSTRQRSTDEILPWDHLDIGVSKAFFKRELENSRNEKVTLNCRADCSGCGAALFGGGVCYE